METAIPEQDLIYQPKHKDISIYIYTYLYIYIYIYMAAWF